ncbi:MAG: hypothetical protein ABEJ75_04525 [Candidatus Nanohaloarchaea archaeon]
MGRSPERLFSVTAITFVAYSLLVLSSFPGYSMQMISSGFLPTLIAVKDLSLNIAASMGYNTLFITALYAPLTGVALVSFAISARSGAQAFAGVLPGILVSGCASCGAGIIGLLGFTGALAAMPFSGDLVRIGGLALLLYYLSDLGDPDLCEFNPDE